MMDGLRVHTDPVSPGALEVPSLKPGKRAGAPGGRVMGGGSNLSPSIDRRLRYTAHTDQLELQSELAPPGSRGSCFSLNFKDSN